MYMYLLQLHCITYTYKHVYMYLPFIIQSLHTGPFIVIIQVHVYVYVHVLTLHHLLPQDQHLVIKAKLQVQNVLHKLLESKVIQNYQQACLPV